MRRTALQRKSRAGQPLDRIGRALSGLARQLELPFFDHGAIAGRGPTDARGRRLRDDAVTSTLTPPSVTPLADPRLRRIQLSERVLDYVFRRARRKTIGLSITADGLTVAAPRWVGISQVEEAIRERESWVLTKLADMQRHYASIPKVRWEDGGTIPYLGQLITIRVSARGVRAAQPAYDADARELTIPLPPGATSAQVRDRVETWLQNAARALFRERLAFYEGRLGTAHRVLRLSSAKSRWGSCSADGRILLNWRLIHFPLSSIDYVVAHELAHLKEMNHGPRFWATVANLLPEYEAGRAQVRNPPPELMPTL
jgi:predicted metal-dependent hydrolase